VPAHPSTPAERVPWISTLLAHEGEYGVVTAVSRACGASRQTLYAWRERGRAAVAAAFAPAPAVFATPGLARSVLTLLVSGHASYRGIQTCLREVLGWEVSLGTITGVVAEAGTRAQALLHARSAPAPVPLALDELFGHAPQAAVLSAVDARSGVVWGVAGPVGPDSASWTLVLWELAAHGVDWCQMVHDGGKAAASACTAVAPARPQQRDLWHVLHRCAQVQTHLDRRVVTAVARWEAAERYQAAVAAGARPRQRPPRPVPETVAAVEAAERAAADLRYLTAEIRRLLAVVLLERDRVLDQATRQAELEAALALLAMVAEAAPAAAQADLWRLHRHLVEALPGLLTFASTLDPVQQAATATLGADEVGLVAWAWERRAILDPAGDALLAQLPAAWRPAAERLVAAWEAAVRASSTVEGWHGLLRPHAAVHRTLSPRLLALLAVWHNHRAYARGAHAGQSPLHRSGLSQAPTDWLTALGYPPAPPARLTPRPLTPEVRLAA
jgi:hypothetical protein